MSANKWLQGTIFRYALSRSTPKLPLNHGVRPISTQLTMSNQNATVFVQSLRQRLFVIARTPSYRFLETSEEDQENYETSTLNISGYSEIEIDAAELELGVQFPEVYRSYLSIMGKSPGENFFCGTELAGPGNYIALRESAEDILAQDGNPCVLPENAVIFFEYLGMMFYFFTANGGYDSPLYEYHDGEIKLSCPSLAQTLEDEVSMLEKHHKEELESGGHYLHLSREAGTRIYPARSFEQQPLDDSPNPTRQALLKSKPKPWWRFW